MHVPLLSLPATARPHAEIVNPHRAYETEGFFQKRLRTGCSCSVAAETRLRISMGIELPVDVNRVPTWRALGSREKGHGIARSLVERSGPLRGAAWL